MAMIRFHAWASDRILATARSLSDEECVSEGATYAVFCGAGFHPGEAVTLTVTDSRGVLSWSSQANLKDQFESALAATLCKLLPVTLVATGTSGASSNTVAITRAACPSV